MQTAQLDIMVTASWGAGESGCIIYASVKNVNQRANYYLEIAYYFKILISFIVGVKKSKYID